MEISWNSEFEYKHRNPYHDKLESFDEFVFRDKEAEEFRGNWREKVFKKPDAQLVAEVGTGYGHFMEAYCQDHPEHQFVGLDYRFKRSFQVARRLSKLPERNFRYLRAKGERISFLFGEGELDRLFYFFPDPWPKARHNKKRLFQKPFLDAASIVLKPGAELWVKTDHYKYFCWMLEHLEEEDRFTVELKTFDLHGEHPDHEIARYITKFEKIFLAKNERINALVLRLK